MTDQFPEAVPFEDAGAGTQARFRYQHHCVARHLLLAIYSGEAITVVCEWHEDFLILRGSHAEAVSVKHRELSRGPFSEATLVTDGGLAKLCSTWKKSGEHARCRLMTNQGLTTGAGGGRAVVSFALEEAKVQQRVAASLSKKLVTPPEEVARFLGAFVADVGLPDRRTIATMQRTALLGPAYGALGERSDGRSAEYDALVALIASRNSDPDPLPEDLRLALVSSPDEDSRRRLSATIKARSINSDEAAECLKAARVEPYSTLPASPPEIPQTKMRRKLRAGGLNPTQLQYAARLRNSWYAAEAEERGTPDVENELAAVEAVVHREAGQAQHSAEALGQRPYGQSMLSDLRSRLSVPPVVARQEFSNPVLLEGLAYELTDRCEVWWSADTDVEDGDLDDS